MESHNQQSSIMFMENNKLYDAKLLHVIFMEETLTQTSAKVDVLYY